MSQSLLPAGYSLQNIGETAIMAADTIFASRNSIYQRNIACLRSLAGLPVGLGGVSFRCLLCSQSKKVSLLLDIQAHHYFLIVEVGVSVSDVKVQ